MVSRRLLRVKVLQVCYAYLSTSEQTINQAEKELFFSIDKSYDLYHYLMLLMIDVIQYAEHRIDMAKNKKMPSPEDLNPNTKFIENRLVKRLKENEKFNHYLKSQKLSWTNHTDLVKGLFNEIKDSELYQNYMDSEVRGYNEDKKFVIDVYTKIIFNYEPLYLNLEEQSIYWNDDIEFVIGMVIKTLRTFKATEINDKLMPLFKNEEDRDFVKRLFRKALLNHKEYGDLISKFIKNWDVERIAFMDIVVMSIAISEITEFSDIPVKVSLDEYIEIAKYYSTEKSNVFINGILDKIVDHLRGEGKIRKLGRGLVGELN
ncbi:MAG: transcription antitermination factor NusB [Bacteroidales bacterium]|nr:transcription antitermination factor NusB [Bacteroidales bacterium]